ncbi:TRAP transporter fused permease subunit [Shewanella sp. AS16]|uniref:TRAP transporter permease n=1 Tax=Shewanella sp. AS16 TaxID=2907625 RepID=UPI001F205602|nr:TRAP transporter fused permease subunit [Shewanella sp. AS16]MCE9685744.1 TRAP transporter fused permease subunit [Shewanella sp. AS16]
MEYQEPPTAKLGGFDYLIGAIAIGLTLFQIWHGLAAELSAPVFLPLHLSWVLVLIFLVSPSFAKTAPKPIYHLGRGLDFLCVCASVWAGYVLSSFDYDDLSFLMDGLTPVDLYSGALLLCLLLEATRRTVGWIMSAIAILFLAYTLYGDVLPAQFASKGFELQEVIRFHIFSTNGVFGAPLAISAGVVFVFVLFGALLQVTGAGQFFIDCAFAIAGKYRGGPAKASVLASAALGSISGSAIANTVTTGALTIPMMKRLGYKPEQAAGIEAAASTGGQIMPPVMGAGAFVMAQFTGLPYAEILLVSIAPALLYFFCTLLYVHLMACKLGLEGMTQVEKIGAVVRQGWHYLLPLVLITALLLLSYSPVLVGLAGCLAIVVAAFSRRKTWVSGAALLSGLRGGALMILPISAACATAGIVVGVVGQTGIGLQFTQALLALSGGYLWGAFILIALAAVVLGMGLPVTAAYIVLSVMAVPALNEFGLPILTAHLIVFWLSQTSNVTPPIALAAFAGAGIAGASPMKSAVQAFKLAFGFFIIPLMMAYSGLLWRAGETGMEFSLAILATMGLIVAFACGIEGRLVNGLKPGIRLLLLAIAGSMLVEQPLVRIAGLLGLGLVLLWDWRRGQPTPASQTSEL